MAQASPPSEPQPPTSPRTPGARRRLVDDLAVVLPSWITARLLVVVAYLLAVAVADHWVPGGRTDAMQTGLLSWDAAFYRDIATRGYAGLPAEALRFFPLQPLLARLAALGSDAAAGWSLLLLANAAALVAGVLVRRLVLFERQDEAEAERAVWLTNLFPASFVLVWGYAEALFLALALASFLAARHRRFGLAGAAALAAALTRPVGVLLAAPLAVEALRSWSAGRHTPRDAVARLWAVGAPVLGLASYLAWVGVAFGDPRLPFSEQGSLRGAEDPVTRLIRGIGDLFGAERFGDGLHVPFALAFVVLAVVVVRRWPAPYGLYSILVLVVALSAVNLNSIERYALNAFPLLFALADLTGTPRRERVALAVCGNGLVALAALAWLRVYVP